ncbi:hypothetical protein GCM10028895_31690 [Pontibacter rugosus]
MLQHISRETVKRAKPTATKQMEVQTMKITKIDYAAISAFSQTITDYLCRGEQLRPFYNHFPTLEAFEAQLKEKSFSEAQRQTLHQALQEQYTSISEVNTKVQQNIDLLQQSNTFTITTGHQLNIFTGPLYFIYKIVTAINTCKQLQEKYPDYNFVPSILDGYGRPRLCRDQPL